MTRTINRASTVVKQPTSNRLNGGRHVVPPRWVKGVSGNPKGRPPAGESIAEGIRQIGDRPPTPFLLAKVRQLYGPDHNPATLREGWLMAAAADAFCGDESARNFIADRTEGRAAQPVRMSGDLNVTNDVQKLPLDKLLERLAELGITI